MFDSFRRELMVNPAIMISLITGFASLAFAQPTTIAPDQELRIHAAEDLSVISEHDKLPTASEYLTLMDSIQIALENNFRVRAAKAEIEKQIGVELEERAFILPEVNAGAEYKKIDKDRLSSFDGQTFGTDESWNAITELEQPLFTAGEGTSRRKQGRYKREAAQHAFDGVINEVLLDVKERFFDALLARAQVDVRKQSVNLLSEQLAVAKNRFRAGTVPSFNVLRAEVELANAQTPLIRARNALRLSLEELSRVMGLPNTAASSVEVAVKIRGDLKYREPSFDLPGAVTAAQERRPELRQLELLAKADEEGVDIERAAYFPQLSAFAGYDWESSRFDNDLSDIDSGWSVGLRANWKVFDSSATRGKVKQARAQSVTAQIALDERRKDIEIEVRKALSELLEARELVLASRKVVEQAEESLRQAQARLTSGVGLQLDVLDTQVALTEARTNEVEALHGYNVAEARVEKATAKTLAEHL